MQIPEGLRYTENHEWVAVEDGKAKVGITDYAQDALGDVVFVDLPACGRNIDRRRIVCRDRVDQVCGRRLRPYQRTVVAVNDRTCRRHRRSINSDPFGSSWFIVIEGDLAPLDDLMDSAAYSDFCE